MKGHVLTNDAFMYLLVCIRCGDSFVGEPKYERRIRRRRAFVVDEILERDPKGEWVDARIGEASVRLTHNYPWDPPLPKEAGDTALLSHNQCDWNGLPKPPRANRFGKGKLFKRRWGWKGHREKFCLTFATEKIVARPHGWWTSTPHTIRTCPGEMSPRRLEAYAMNAVINEAYLQSQQIERLAVAWGVMVPSTSGDPSAAKIVMPVTPARGTWESRRQRSDRLFRVRLCLCIEAFEAWRAMGADR